jgi:hypothetical protein
MKLTRRMPAKQDLLMCITLRLPGPHLTHARRVPDSISA